jgi:hypothetical protein
MLRAALARLAATAEAGGRDDAGAARAVAQRALETAFAARGAARIFAALAKGGAEAADRLRVMPLAADNDPGADASEAASHRLQPAA